MSRHFVLHLSAYRNLTLDHSPCNTHRLFRGINPDLAKVLCGLLGMRGGLKVHPKTGKYSAREPYDPMDPFSDIVDLGILSDEDDDDDDDDDDEFVIGELDDGGGVDNDDEDDATRERREQEEQAARLRTMKEQAEFDQRALSALSGDAVQQALQDLLTR
jgi:hypothetical protein